MYIGTQTVVWCVVDQHRTSNVNYYSASIYVYEKKNRNLIAKSSRLKEIDQFRIRMWLFDFYDCYDLCVYEETN